MKTEDFERLKKLCDENGFELVTESPKENDKFFVVKKKDEWEGVEFFMDAEGIVWKIKNETERKVLHMFEKCKPSTEQAYIEQLKKEAFQRFGEIKDGDRFDCSPIGYSPHALISLSNTPEWKYDKKRDELTFESFLLYKQGKWAELVKERVEVNGIHSGGSNNYNNISDWKYHFEFSLKNYHGDNHGAEKMHNKVLPFLAEQLEKYLNNEI